MAFPFLFRSKNKKAAVVRRRRRKTEAGSAFIAWLEESKLVKLGVFMATVLAIFVISFVGVSPAAFNILPNQIATVRLIADTDFSYRSKILTERAKERQLKQVPPVFRIDLSALEEFEKQERTLLAELNELDKRWKDLNEAERLRELTRIADEANVRGGLQVSVRDLATLMNYGDAEDRQRLIENGLFILREIHRSGIYDPDADIVPTGERELMMFQIARDSGQLTQTRPSTIEEAQTTLRANLAAENIPAPVLTALVRLLRSGIRPNLVYDDAASEALRQQYLENFKDVIVNVEAGRSIIERNTRVTEEQYEMLKAYQNHLNEMSRVPTMIDNMVFSRILLVFGMLIIAGFYIRLEDPETLRSNSRLALLAIVLVFSLGLVRVTLEAGNSPLFSGNPETAALLPYVAPTAFAPMIIAVLIGAGPALFSGLLISVFSAIMFGNRLEVLVISFLTATVAAYACRKVRRRSRVVRAGWLSGLALALFVLLLGLSEKMLPDLMIKAVIGGQLTGLLTGIVVVGLLPLLEGLFKRTTDITLLELTDFNHPLLRRMQMDAPGTYHHSLMVANLSENAANAIGANALLCRVCCMFHDIGKMVKPEYFTENQRDGINPHNELTPSFSALIIKSHVKEGIDLAIKHKLPRPVIDVIRQHHGTTLIRFFHQRAIDQARQEAEDAHNAATPPVDESTYRYDGPRPNFAESAIILLADSIEAASRSLQKVTPQAVEELVDAIVEEKIADGQLDDAPLTIRDIARIKESFNFTLLNSLHTRVVYPKAEKTGSTATQERRDSQNQNRTPTHAETRSRL